MKAVGYEAKGGFDVLTDIELPMPAPGPRDLLVAVKAVSVNPVDTKRRRWDSPPAGSKFMVLGYDAAGVVEAVGDAVTLFKPGDEVFYAGAFDRPGTNAEFHAVDERIVGIKPKSLNFAAAAALPLTAITAWEILFDRMKLPRQGATGTILVIAGAGGVGSIFVQLARRLTGMTVIASASRPKSAAFAEMMGAHVIVDHRQPLDEAVRKAGFDGIDYVAALTTTPESIVQIIRVLKPQGHVNFIDDPATEILPFKMKSLTVSWEMMFTRSLFHTDDMVAQHALLNEVSALMDAGTLRTTLTETIGPIDAANLRKAHAAIEGGRTIGKVVLDGFSG